MSPRTPRVTVALITYNHERYVAEAISSILAQTYTDFELLVVDDGSTDGTPAVIRGVRDERIRYLRQENQGPASARNAALREARGEYIAQMSGDDVAEPHRLARQVEALDGRKDRVVFSYITVIGESGRARGSGGETVGSAMPPTDLIQMANRPRAEILRHLFKEGNCFCAPTAFAAREVFESVGGYDVLLLQVQDWDIWIRLLLRGVQADTVPEALLRYRIRARQGNLSSPTVPSLSRSFFEVRKMLQAYRSIATVAELRTIFPEVDRLEYPLEDDFTAFYLALLAMRDEGGNWGTGYFGGDLLFELMARSDFRRAAAERLSFRLPDLFRALGSLDARRYGLESSLAVIMASRSWRLTRPLRTLRRFGARLGASVRSRAAR